MRDVVPLVSVTHHGNISKGDLCVDCKARGPEGVECREGAIGQNGAGQAVSPHVLSPHVLEITTLHSYVTVEAIYNTVHAHHDLYKHHLKSC